RILHDGTISIRHTYVSRVGRPILGVDGTGEVAVVRGSRRPGPNDLTLPEEGSASGTNSVGVVPGEATRPAAPILPPPGAPKAR
ncbi:MAG: hypothetical protein ACKOKG_02325, partial [Verrucomicrobiota bacterium]